MSVRLSVVIPTHDKLPQLRRTLAALRTQDLTADIWEVVVVDDASTDGTADWLSTEAIGWGGRLRVVSPERNLGRARARTLGVTKAAGEWILFLDDDVVAPKDLLAAHLSLLEAYPGEGVIGMVRTDPDLVDAPHFHYIDTRGVAKVRGDRVPARYLVTQNTSVPREDLLAVACFDEAFAAYGFEDMDLGFRLEKERGLRFRPLRDPVPRHVHHHTLEAWLRKKRECGHGPLQRIAEVHPDRLREMGLHWVLEPSGMRASFPLRVLRRLARGGGRRVLQGLLRSWPTSEGARPVQARLYARLMDLLIVATYCQGVSDGMTGAPGD